MAQSNAFSKNSDKKKNDMSLSSAFDKEGKKGKWRLEHEAFLANIRINKKIQKVSYNK